MTQPESDVDLGEKVVVYLKTGEVIKLDELTIDNLRNNIYDEWEYAGWADPLGQASATIINTITGALTPLINGVKSVVDSILSRVGEIWNVVKDIPSKLTDIGNAINALVDRIKNAIGGAFDNFRTWLLDQFSNIGNALNAFKEMLINIGNTIKSKFEEITNKIGEKFADLKNAISGFVDKVEQFFEDIKTKLEGAFKDVINKLSEGFDKVKTFLGDIKDRFEIFVDYIKEGFENVYNFLKENVITKLKEGFDSVKNFLSDIVERVRAGFEAIKTTFTTLLHQLQTIVGDIPKILSGITEKIRGIIKPVVDAVKDLPNALKTFVTDILEKFRSWFASIMDGITTIANTFRGFINPLVEIKNWLEQRFRDTMKWLYENVAKPVYEKVLAPIVDAIKSFIGDPLGTLKNAFDKVIEFFTNVGEKAKQLFAPIVDAFKSFVSDPLSKIKDVLKPLFDFFANVEEKAKEFFKPIVDALGKIDLSGIVRFVEDIKKAIGEALSDPIGWIKGIIDKVVEFVKNCLVNPAMSFIRWLIGGIKGFAEGLKDILGKLFSELSDFAKGFVKTVFLDPLSKAFGLDEFMETNEALLKRGLFTSPDNVAEELFFYVKALSLLSAPFNVGLGMYWLGHAMLNTSGFIKDFSIRLSSILARFGVVLEPEKIARGLIESGSEMMKEYLKTWMFVTSFWIYEPFKYWVNPIVRWGLDLPHEIPTYHEIVRSTRRFLPCKVLAERGQQEYATMFNTMIEKLHRIMDFRGMPFWFEVITLGEYTPEEVFKEANIPTTFSFTIKDRFGTDREIPMLLLYELPTPSDTVRMMLRDVIQSLDDFEAIMASHGFTRDITAMYYLLHFKYPSPSALFEFVSRVAGGIVWVERKGNIENIVKNEIETFSKWGLGFEPKSPMDLAKSIENIELPKPSQTPASIDTSKIDQAVMSRFQEIVGYIMPYFKWHDYFPMSWINGFTSDQMIAIELSADIPQRIDARWMFKWGIISDTDLLRIVMARGMHPAWASKITIAEVMNAMSEERTFARTGIVNAFKEGFTTEDLLKKQFKHLADIEVLGIKVPVIFLEGEAKLLTLRAKYDRAIDILRDLVRQCVHAYQKNIFDFNTFKQKIKKVLEKLKNTLNIPLKFDEKYYNAYKEYLDVYHEVDTIDRVRSWIRYSMYQLLYRFMRGYVSESEAKKLVDLFVDIGKLTDEEREVFEKLMDFMLNGYVHEVKVRAVLRKLSRGTISLDEAKSELEKLGIPKDLSEALIDAYAKQYTLSISSYLTYADYVKIDENLLKKKLELLGVPKDEQEIILEVFKIKPIRSEMSRAIERLLDMFENGYLTEDELKNMLKQYNLSRVGIEFLILASKFKKEAYKKKLEIDAIIHKFKRGAISLKEAREKLKKIIKDEEIVDYILEKNVRIYEFSVDKLVSMREYVPIDINKVVEKAKEFGYPEDEIKLLPAYVVARELDEEIRRLANEYGNDFVEGLITEKEFRKALDELATLNGTVKKKYNVDWIVLSPEERELLVTLYKLRKQRYEARRRRSR